MTTDISSIESNLADIRARVERAASRAGRPADEITIIAVSLAVAGGVAFADNKDTVAVPNGLAFSEFKGYEDWQVITVSKAKVGNADVINADLLAFIRS